MSDPVKHECGIALIRLLKPLSYYIEKYGTPLYGLNKLYLLMEKQHNRGQDGAGISNVKLDVDPGQQYIFRKRSVDPSPIADIFNHVQGYFRDAYEKFPDQFSDAEWLKNYVPYSGELMLGHLRYSTHSKSGLQFCHPLIKQNNWMSRNLVIAGNFNMTNNDELFNHLVKIGQHPRAKNDTVTVLEKFGHFLDEENERLYRKFREAGYSKKAISPLITQNLSVKNVLQNSSEDLDGGYSMAGMIGHGDAFVLRDPNGIRPAYYYHDDEILVVTSERPAIKTAFNLPFHDIPEIKPGHAIISRKNGDISHEEILPPKNRKSCSFERIYFSRGSDEVIYKERKKLGQLLTNDVLESIDHDLKHTVLSYIPNTAETSFIGLVKGIEDYLNQYKKEQILNNPQLKADELDQLLDLRPRVEQLAIKDAKLRTFITKDEQRNDLVAHIYDTTYGVVEQGKDQLVIMDDSIVRGTTLKQSIISILSRLEPKKIIIVSSAPQIRYPDCYGIDMSKIDDFVAFKAAIALLKEHGKEHVIEEVYQNCKAQENVPAHEQSNQVKAIYDPFTAKEISNKIAELVKPEYVGSEVEVIYQSIENLHQACPNNSGDWYFTGNFPTPGGNKVINNAYINFYEGRNERAY